LPDIEVSRAQSTFHTPTEAAEKIRRLEVLVGDLSLVVKDLAQEVGRLQTHRHATVCDQPDSGLPFV
jgi:hypothetical protein